MPESTPKILDQAKRKGKFLSSLTVLPAYEGWTQDEIIKNVAEIMTSGDQTRVKKFTQALASNHPAYEGWSPEEVNGNLAEIFGAPSKSEPTPNKPESVIEATTKMTPTRADISLTSKTISSEKGSSIAASQSKRQPLGRYVPFLAGAELAVEGIKQVADVDYAGILRAVTPRPPSIAGPLGTAYQDVAQTKEMDQVDIPGEVLKGVSGVAHTAFGIMAAVFPAAAAFQVGANVATEVIPASKYFLAPAASLYELVKPIEEQSQTERYGAELVDTILNILIAHGANKLGSKTNKLWEKVKSGLGLTEAEVATLPAEAQRQIRGLLPQKSVVPDRQFIGSSLGLIEKPAGEANVYFYEQAKKKEAHDKRINEGQEQIAETPSQTTRFADEYPYGGEIPIDQTTQSPGAKPLTGYEKMRKVQEDALIRMGEDAEKISKMTDEELQARAEEMDAVVKPPEGEQPDLTGQKIKLKGSNELVTVAEDMGEDGILIDVGNGQTRHVPRIEIDKLSTAGSNAEAINTMIDQGKLPANTPRIGDVIEFEVGAGMSKAGRKTRGKVVRLQQDPVTGDLIPIIETASGHEFPAAEYLDNGRIVPKSETTESWTETIAESGKRAKKKFLTPKKGGATSVGADFGLSNLGESAADIAHVLGPIVRKAQSDVSQLLAERKIRYEKAGAKIVELTKDALKRAEWFGTLSNDQQNRLLNSVEKYTIFNEEPHKRSSEEIIGDVADVGKSNMSPEDLQQERGDAAVKLKKASLKYADEKSVANTEALHEAIVRAEKSGLIVRQKEDGHYYTEEPMEEVRGYRRGKQEAPEYELTEGGLVKMGASPADLARQSASNLYSGNPATNVANELLQNAIDAVRETSDPKVDVQVRKEGKDSYITVTDNGGGMSREELSTVFVNLGESGKRNNPRTSGKFGQAKAIIFLAGEEVEVRTRNLRMKFTPEEIMERGAKIEEVPANEAINGTQITVKFEGQDFPSSLLDKVRTITEYTDIPISVSSIGHNVDILPDYAKPLPRKPFVHKNQDDYRIAEMRSVIEKELESRLDRTDVGEEFDIGILTGDRSRSEFREDSGKIKVLNNGVYVLEKRIPEVGAEFENIVIDLHSTAEVGTREYPFTTNRQNLTYMWDDVVDALISDIKDKEVSKTNKMYEEAIFAAPEVATYGGKKMKIMGVREGDVGRLTELLDQSPSVKLFMSEFHSAFDRITEVLTPYLRKQFATTLEVGSLGLTNSQGYHGINFKAQGGNHIFFSPESFIQAYDKPSAQAIKIVDTIVHELAHNVIRPHGTEHTSVLGHSIAALGDDYIPLLAKFEKFFKDNQEDFKHEIKTFGDIARDPKESRIFTRAIQERDATVGGGQHEGGGGGAARDIAGPSRIRPTRPGYTENVREGRFEEGARQRIADEIHQVPEADVERILARQSHARTEQLAKRERRTVIKARAGTFEEGHPFTAAQLEALDSELNRIGKMTPEEILTRDDPQQVSNLLRTILSARHTAGQALNILGKEVDPAVAESFRKLQATMPDEVVREVAEMLERRVKPPPGEWDKIAEWGRNIKLASVSSLIRSSVGNATMQLFRYPELFTEISINKLRNAISGGTSDRTYREIAADFVGTKAGLREGLKTAWKILKEDPDVLSENIFLMNEAGRQSGAIGGRFGKIVRTPQRAQGAVDALLRIPTARGLIGRWAMRKALSEGLRGEAFLRRAQEYINNPTPEIIAHVSQDAAYITFQQQLGPVGNAFSNLRYAHPGLQTLVPFFNNPVNLFKAGVERTPFAVFTPSFQQALNVFSPQGRLKTKVESGLRNITGKKVETGETFDVKMSRMVVGTAALSFVSNMLFNIIDGQISGGPPKSKEEIDALERGGWKPYSVKLGDMWYSYRGFEPISSWLGLMADIGQGYQTEGVQEAVLEATGNLFSNFAENPFATGFADIIDAVRDKEGKKWEKWISGFATGMVVPTLVQQTRSVIDPTIRVPEGIGERISARIPGLSTNAPAKVNVFGEEIVQDHPWTRVVGTSVSEVKHSAVEDEIARLGLKLGWASDVYAGIKLTDEQTQLLRIVAGKEFKKALEMLVNSPVYQDMTDGIKATMIQNTQSSITDLQRRTLFLTEAMEGAVQKVEENLTGGAVSKEEKEATLRALRRGLGLPDTRPEDMESARKRGPEWRQQYIYPEKVEE